MNVIKGLQDVNGSPITSMGANFTSKPYELNDNIHLGLHVFWDNVAVQGLMTLQYSCDPVSSVLADAGVQNWVDKSAVNIDGSFTEIMFLDSNLPVASYRLVFAYTSGSANLQSYTVTKTGRL